MARGAEIESFDDGYAMSSCTECRKRMTADRLTFFTIEVQSGRRSGRSSSTYFGKRPSSRSSSSSSTYYKNVQKRMCDPCYEAYQIRLAREAKIKLLIGGVVAVFILWCWLMPSKKEPVPTAQLPARVASSARYVDAPTIPMPMAPQPNVVPSPSTEVALATTPTPDALALPQPVPPPEDLYTVNYLANIRSSPNNGPIVGQARAGEELSVVEIKGSWARVRRGDQVIGWIHRNLLTGSER